MMKNVKSRSWFIVSIIVAFTIAVLCFGVSFGVLGTDEKYVANAGVSDYSIVIPKNAGGNEKNAARELQFFFEKATGAKLPIVNDAGKTAGGKYFSVGNTAFVPSSVSAAVSDNKSCGYVVKTVGDTVYLLGNTENGTLYSVYGFLAEEFGFDYYFTDVYDLTEKSSLELKAYDLDVDPDIDMMGGPSVGLVQDITPNKLRFNALATAEIFLPLNGSTQTHNVFKIIPKADFASEHPYWYSDDKTTACFTAHGNGSEYAAMKAQYLSVIKEGLKKSSAKYVQIGLPDNSGFCGCDRCNSDVSIYGKSGVMIRFLNDLADDVYAWFDTAEGALYARDLKIMALAYQNTKTAPTGGVSCDPHVGVYIGFDGFGGSFPITDTSSGGNSTHIGYLNAWQDKAETFMFWLYDVNFNYYSYPYDTSVYKQAFYQKMKDMGAVMVNDEGQYDNVSSTIAWSNLKSYLSCKLRWNVNADVNALTDKFFAACYKSAASQVKSVYDSVLSRWATLRSSGYYGANKLAIYNIFGEINQTKYWPKTTIKSWIAGLEDALSTLDESGLAATDRNAYNTARQMICSEIVSPLYMLLDLYGNDYSSAERTALKLMYKAYADESQVDTAILNYKSSSAPVYVGD